MPEFVVRLELVEVGVDRESGNEYRNVVDAWESPIWARTVERLVADALVLVWGDLARVDVKDLTERR